MSTKHQTYTRSASLRWHRYLSVCSGIEAASVAWEPLGWQPVAFSEIDAFPSAVLAHHYPAVPNWGDMTRYQEWPDATIDLLVGGTPCQSFSVAGLRRGMADPRGNLALTYLGIADRYRPEWMVWENVPGVLSSNGGRDFGALLGALGELGYGFAYRVLDAQYLGVPQRRRRVFVVGHLGDWRRAAAVLFERQSLSGDSPPSREEGTGVARESPRSVALRGREGGGTAELGDDKALALRASQGGGDKPHALIAHTLRAEGFDASEDGTGRGTPLVPTTAPCLTSNYGKQPDSSDTNAGPMVVPIAFAENSRAELRLENGDGSRTGTLSTGGGKMGQGVPAIAFQSKTSPSQSINPAGVTPSLDVGKCDGMAVQQSNLVVRRLTPRECERLQGLPDDWTRIPYRNKPAEQCPDGPRYRALGNSFAVPVVRWIGERIQKVSEL